jgi:hypothetical protein
MSSFNRSVGEKALIKIIFIDISVHETTRSSSLLPLIERMLYAEFNY